MALFRTLDPAEEAKFRQWARENYTPFSPIDGIWHPLIQDECRTINTEAGGLPDQSSPLPTGVQGSNPMILKIGDRASFEVSTFEEASQIYAQIRDASLEGASTFPDGIILDGTRTVARVSYNAKVWPPAKWSEGHMPLFNPYSR
jgi:hypothetical protein